MDTQVLEPVPETALATPAMRGRTGPVGIKQLAVKLGIMMAVVVSLFTLTPATQSHAAQRQIDLYVGSSGAYVGNVSVYRGQYPNGGATVGQRLTYGQVTAGGTFYRRLYFDDNWGWTIYGAASFGKSRWFVFGQGSADRVCMWFSGTTIVGFNFYNYNC
ncbi:hypothetical protein [Kitasatospora sp. NPDC057015]|uniref:hypothetical protein n=1 Tax=Kitasatospora sp. NPDC057015 TaxID=3346001 RepID=UPI0036443EAA